MVTPQQWNIFFTAVSTLMGQAWVGEPEPIAASLCQQVPSATDVQGYGWTGMIPKMRIWNGSRVAFEAAPQTYFVTNQPFESTLVVDRFRLEDDQFGVLYRQLPDMARQAKRQPDYMLRDLLENINTQAITVGMQTGSIQNGLDGLSFFNTAHPINLYNPSQKSQLGLTSYCNDFTGGGQTIAMPKSGGGTSNVVVGGALSPAALATVYEYMTLISGEDGESLGVSPNAFMCGGMLALDAQVLLKNQYFAPPTWQTLTGQVGSAENALTRFGLELIINKFLTNSFTWYMADTTRGMKPFVHQVRNETVMVPRVAETDPNVFDRHELMFGQWNRQAMGWGPSFLAARSGP